MAINVLFAVYGGLRNGDPLQLEAANVTDTVQAYLNAGDPGRVVINNQNMGGDPAVGVKKHFGALIQIDNGQPRAYACIEGQEIAILA
jgi:hypothetical protein